MSQLIPFTITVDQNNGIDVDIAEHYQYTVLVDNNAYVVNDKNKAVAELKYALDHDYCYPVILEDAIIEDFKSIVKSLENTVFDKKDPKRHAEEALMTLIFDRHDDFLSDVASDVAEVLAQKLLSAKLIPIILRKHPNRYTLKEAKSDEIIDIDKVDEFAQWFAENFVFSLTNRIGYDKPRFIPFKKSQK